MAQLASNALSEDLVSALSRRGDLRTFSRGEILIAEGDVSDSFFILLAGELKVFTRDERSRELVYNVLRPGEFFGEMCLDGRPRSASVKAVCTSMCAVVDLGDLQAFIKSYPEFAESLILKLIDRVRHATEQTKSLALNGVYERVIGLLNQVAFREGAVRIVDRTITQQEIANRVGATREMVNHILGDLIRGGFMARDEERRLVLTKELPKHW